MKTGREIMEKTNENESFGYTKWKTELNIFFLEYK